MRIQIMLALVALVATAATEASAQGVNLSGPYQCVVNCAGPGPATVTQNGWDLNLVNEIGRAFSSLGRLAGSHLGSELERGRDLFAGRNDYSV
jgi:hypothetical protein